MKHRSCWAWFIVLALVLIVSPLWAQKVTGTISGIVTDTTGAVVPQVAVLITNTDTGLTRTVTSNDMGEYVAPDLPNGNYQISVKQANFKEAVINHVELHVASTALVNIQLQVGNNSEQITVEANTIQVQTDSAQLGEVVQSAQVQDLPLNGRNFVALTQLQPGVAAARSYDAVGKGLKGGVDFAVNGNSMDNNLFLVDGANNNDVGSNRTILVYPSIESIQEFKMLRNAYGPEYGQASGGVVNIVTKSGTNNWHGSIFYSGRNDSLDAYDWFAARQATQDRLANTFHPSTGSIYSNPNQDKPVLRRNDFGYSLGGPIKKDKLFFFWNQEWNREVRGVGRSGCVPNAAERGGDFSNVTCGDTITTAFPLALQGANQWTIAQPLQAIVDQMGQFPLPNFTCPTTPAGTGTAATGASGCNNWQAFPSTHLNYRQENIRTDYNVTKSHVLTFRYTQDTWVNPAPSAGYWGDDAFPQLESSWAQPAKSIIGKVTSMIGSNLINTAEFSYSNNRILITPGGTATGLAATLNADYPTIFPADLKTHPIGIPALNLGNTGGTTQMLAPWSNKEDLYNVRDDLSWVHGNHTFKFGAFLGFNLKNEANGGATSERTNFNTANAYVSTTLGTAALTGMPMANAMIPGNVYTGLSETSTDIYNQMRWRDYEVYAGDSWKVNRKLLVELGVRYSMLLSPYQVGGLMTSFNPNLYDPNGSPFDACNGLWTVPGKSPCTDANTTFGRTGQYAFSAGTPGPNKYLKNQNYHLFAPRLGLAYDLFGDGKTAIRAGLGQFYQRDRTAIYTMSANAPFALTASGYSRTLDGASLTATQFSQAATSATGGVDPSNAMPNSWQWNVSVERSLAREMSLQVAYVGNRAIHQLTTSDINEVPQSQWATCAFMSNCNSLRPYPNDGFLTWWSHFGDANYHSLQALFRGKVKGAYINATYTYSHSIGNVPLDESNGTANSQTLTLGSNPSLDRGNTQINRPHIFVANLLVPLPELKGHSALVRNVAGGWQVGGITTAESGPSTTVNSAGLSENTALLTGGAGSALGLNALYGTGNAGPPWAPGSNRRPSITGVSCTSGTSGPNIYNPAAFTVVGQAIGTIGNEPLGYCHGPKFVTTDFTLQKNWKITERVALQFRLDTFNLFNHPNFSPNANGSPIGSVNCGTATGGLYQPCSPTNSLITLMQPGASLAATGIMVNSDREIQYGLRVTF
jgi:hypothetical protein